MPGLSIFSWLSLVSNQLEKQVTSTVKHCYLTVEPHVVYKTNQLLPVANEDVLPALQNNNVNYQFSCHCGSRYVGSTSSRLRDRIKQHVPNLSVIALLSKHFTFQFENANIPPSQQLKLILLRMIRLLDFFSYAIPLVLNTMMIACYQFSQKKVCYFIIPLLKPSLLSFQPYSLQTKRNCFKLKFSYVSAEF